MEPESNPSTWIVGLDLRPHSHGAINFARWLHQNDTSGTMRFDGLHVVDSALLELPTAPARTQLLGAAERAAHTALKVREADGVFTKIDAIAASGVVDTFAAAGELEICEALVLGRRAAGNDQSIVRLGKVARRLLRRLTAPTFVVPCDLELEHIGAGPIVCAVDLSADSVALARYGEALGARLGREIRLVHVVGGSDPVGLAHIPELALGELQSRRRETTQASLQAWRDAAGLSAPTLLAQGHVVPKLIRAARELDACMILTGSRRSSLVERMFFSSVGSTLAACAYLPVGVIASPSA